MPEPTTPSTEERVREALDDVYDRLAVPSFIRDELTRQIAAHLPEATTRVGWGVRYCTGTEDEEVEEFSGELAELAAHGRVDTIRKNIAEDFYDAEDYEPMEVVSHQVTSYATEYGPWVGGGS